MDIEGKIIFDLGEQSGVAKASGNPWRKHEWVMETNGAYPRKVKFTVFGENRCNDMQFVPGNSYRVSVDIESREYQGRWYTDVNAYAMSPLDAAAPMEQQPVPPTQTMQGGFPGATDQPATQFGAPADGGLPSGNAEDDLPF